MRASNPGPDGAFTGASVPRVPPTVVTCQAPLSKETLRISPLLPSVTQAAPRPSAAIAETLEKRATSPGPSAQPDAVVLPAIRLIDQVPSASLAA